MGVFALPFMPDSGHAGSDGQPEPVRLDLYVMSQCPFGVQAENVIFPVVQSLAPDVDFNLQYIGNETVGPGGTPAFQSLHGQPEVDENIRQLCAMKHFPNQYMDFILERNANNAKDPHWEDAAKKAGLDPAVLEACASGEEGRALLSTSFKAAQKRQANSSPTIDINGAPYTGARGLRSVTLALCDALAAKGAALPKACEKATSLPPDPAAAGGCGPGGGAAAQAAPPVAFDVQVVADTECSFCQPTLVDALKRQHPRATVTVIAANTPEGQELLKRYQVESLPFYLLDKKVEQEQNFTTLFNSYYAKAGEHYTVKPGVETYTPSVQLQRERAPRHLDLFVESLSPFTAQVEGELFHLLQQSQAKDLTFSIHFVVQETAKAESAGVQTDATSPSTDVRAASLGGMKDAGAGPLTSRRNEAELQEDLRQVCLFQRASIGTFFTYLNCRNQNLQDAGRADTCLTLSDPVSRCLTGGEGGRLLRQDATLTRELGITGGPFLLWENRYGPFGWHEVDWKQLLSGSE